MLRKYVNALDPGGTTGVACLFGASSGSSSSATFAEETMNITGAAGAVVTIQVTTYDVTNIAGQVFADSVQRFLNNVFTVTLSGGGTGSFLARVQGDAGDTGTIVRAIFTITGVTIGHIGTPNTKQISKVF